MHCDWPRRNPVSLFKSGIHEQAAMASDQHQTMKKRNRVAARLTRGSQPGRRREKGKRFSADDQPKRSRGRPPGATNLMTRELKEAILGGCSDCGADGKGKGGLRGYMRKLAMEDKKAMGMLLRAILPADVKVEVTEQKSYPSLDEVKAKLAELGIPTDVVYQLEHYKGPLIEAEPEKSE